MTTLEASPDEIRAARLQLLARAARRDPVAWARLTSRGAWYPHRHAEMMIRECQATAEAGGRLLIPASVRHFKTHSVVHSWASHWLGSHPDQRIIHGTAETTLASENSSQIRERLRDFGEPVFGVKVDRRSSAKKQWQIEDHAGGMIAIGRGGSPEGWGGSILLDDPYRSFADAMSPVVRKQVQEWWANTLRPRMQPGAFAIILCARWHLEDLLGWLIAEFGDLWRVLRMPALCDDPENDPLGRALGEPLCPEVWDADALELAKRETSIDEGEATWMARYQQTPIDLAFSMFPLDQWKTVRGYADAELARSITRDAPEQIPEWIMGRKVTHRVRAWDLAATGGGGDWTVGVLLALLDDRDIVVEDVVRGQWGSDVVREQMRQVADLDAQRDSSVGLEISIPQDPGQAGVDQVNQLQRLLIGHRVVVRRPTGPKLTRAAGWSSYQKGGHVYVIDPQALTPGSQGDPHVRAFKASHRSFTGRDGEQDDDVDAAADGFAVLAEKFTAGGTIHTDAFEGLTRMA